MQKYTYVYQKALVIQQSNWTEQEQAYLASVIKSYCSPGSEHSKQENAENYKPPSLVSVLFYVSSVP